MKFLKSLLMGTGCVVLAGLVLALLAPRAVHAVVATAVQIVNTSASPAITEDTSRQASQIVTIQCVMSSSQNPSCHQVLPNGTEGGQQGPYGGYVVPANQYFVLKSMEVDETSNYASIDIQLISPPNNLLVEDVTLQRNSQISFSSGIVAGPGVEVSPQNYSAFKGLLILHGYLTSN
jgi:hypothetical protein